MAHGSNTSNFIERLYKNYIRIVSQLDEFWASPLTRYRSPCRYLITTLATGHEFRFIVYWGIFLLWFFIVFNCQPDFTLFSYLLMVKYGSISYYYYSSVLYFDQEGRSVDFSIGVKGKRKISSNSKRLSWKVT